jgi:hypothetical protein
MLVVLNWVALVIAIFTGVGLLFSRDWRWSLGLLAIQYISVFWMTQAHWPVSMAATKLITGWMACTILGITQRNIKDEREIENTRLQGRLFHIFAAGMVIAVTFALALPIVDWLGISLPVAWGCLVVIGLGLLHLGITSESLKVIIGLLTVLAGFEVLYAAVENSALVAALLSVVNLGMALVGAYFLNVFREKTP